MAQTPLFKLPRISTLAGSSLRSFFKSLKGQKVVSGSFLKLSLTFVFILVATPFRWYERLIGVKMTTLPQPPVFILGHWRSGTTYLHNVLCQDPAAAYVTTYQSLFPELLGSKWLFKSFMRYSMPGKRPGDNVLLSVDYPQEEEFALGNMHPYCYYHFFHFPQRYQEYYQKYARFATEPAVRQQWKHSYQRLVLKACYNTKGQRMILKNPVNTARIPILLELYPDAKFIFIYRNPVIVYLSSKRFFSAVLPGLRFQPFSSDETERMILEVYNKLMQDYTDTRALIPKENLMEIRFEEFEKNPLNLLEKLYKQFEFSNFAKANPFLAKYVRSQKSYQKNEHKISRRELDNILNKWGDTMERWNYEIPANLEIIE